MYYRVLEMSTLIGFIIFIGLFILIYTYRYQVKYWYKQTLIDIECASLRKQL